MFEKEAEEYIMREDVSTENDRVPFDNGYGFQTVSFEDEVKKAFKDGAEFGYNKAFVEADKNLKAIVTDFNKANKWHYPSKGEYPKERENVLCYCYCKGTEIKFYCIGHTVIGGDNKIRWWSSDRSEKLKVYAWKEITPPKEIEEK